MVDCRTHRCDGARRVVAIQLSQNDFAGNDGPRPAHVLRFVEGPQRTLLAPSRIKYKHGYRPEQLSAGLGQLGQLFPKDSDRLPGARWGHFLAPVPSSGSPGRSGVGVVPLKGGDTHLAIRRSYRSGQQPVLTEPVSPSSGAGSHLLQRAAASCNWSTSSSRSPKQADAARARSTRQSWYNVLSVTGFIPLVVVGACCSVARARIFGLDDASSCMATLATRELPVSGPPRVTAHTTCSLRRLGGISGSGPVPPTRAETSSGVAAIFCRREAELVQRRDRATVAWVEGSNPSAPVHVVGVATSSERLHYTAARSTSSAPSVCCSICVRSSSSILSSLSTMTVSRSLASPGLHTRFSKSRATRSLVRSWGFFIVCSSAENLPDSAGWGDSRSLRIIHSSTELTVQQVSQFWYERKAMVFEFNGTTSRWRPWHGTHHGGRTGKDRWSSSGDNLENTYRAEPRSPFDHGCDTQGIRGRRCSVQLHADTRLRLRTAANRRVAATTRGAHRG